jgi:hypothetical protein
VCSRCRPTAWRRHLTSLPPARYPSASSRSLKHAFVVSSAAVCGPNHENAGLLDETAFIPAGRSDIADLWHAVETLTKQIGERSGAGPTLRTVLRPAALLDGSDYFSRLFKGRIAVTYPGHDPSIQFLSLADLADALATVVSRRGEGISTSRRPGRFR